MSYPETCLRGLRSRECVTREGRVHGTSFLPVLTTAQQRQDGRSEASINFEDDEGALPLLRRDKANAGHGVARLPLSVVDSFRGTFKGGVVTVEYERKRKKGNDYHGNLLFPAGIDKVDALAIAAYLACSAELVPDQQREASSPLPDDMTPPPAPAAPSPEGLGGGDPRVS